MLHNLCSSAVMFGACFGIRMTERSGPIRGHVRISPTSNHLYFALLRSSFVQSQSPCSDSRFLTFTPVIFLFQPPGHSKLLRFSAPTTPTHPTRATEENKQNHLVKTTTICKKGPGVAKNSKILFKASFTRHAPPVLIKLIH